MLKNSPFGLNMNNLGKYWKPQDTKPISTKAFKKMKAKHKKKTDQSMPTYNNDWISHWKTL